MNLTVTHDRAGPMRQRIRIRAHELIADEQAGNGGEDAGPDAHDLYDAALGACKALTLLWYARRKGIALDDVQVEVESDRSQEQAGSYRLRTALRLGGRLSEADRERLLAVAGKCPVHRLMTQVRTEIETVLADAAG
jgi:putative redox protein